MILLEHERWKCFYGSEGFIAPSLSQIDLYKNAFGLNNYMAKFHPALVSIKELIIRKKILNSNYVRNDIFLVLQMYDIISEYYNVFKE